MNQKARQALITWVAVYPIITLLALILESPLRDWPVPARTLLLSAVMVPLMVFWAVPTASRWFAGFLNPTNQVAPEMRS
ncbi:MAG: hypothetical protein AAGL66_09660 [Pseudomonadota bacterium]